MIKFGPLLQNSNGMPIPFANMNIEKCVLQRVDRWMFIRQLKKREEVAKKKTFKKKEKKFNLMTNYDLECMEAKQRQVEGMNKSVKNRKALFKTPDYLKGYTEYVSTPEYKRISPEMLTLFEKKDIMLESATDDSRRSTKKSAKFVASSKPTLEDANPTLAKYLQGVMESGNIMINIYGIDYYQNSDPDDEKLASESLRHMDPNDIAYIFALLNKKVKLNHEQKEHFKEFLAEISTFTPDEMREYLKFLQNRGMLTQVTLNLIIGSLGTMSHQMQSSEYQKLMDFFGNKAEVKLLLKNNKNVSTNLLLPTNARLLTHIRGERLQSISFPHRMSSTGTIVSFGQKINDKNIDHNITRKPSSAGSHSIESLESTDGFDMGKIHNPWNINLPWRDFSKFPHPIHNWEKSKQRASLRDDIRLRVLYDRAHNLKQV